MDPLEEELLRRARLGADTVALLAALAALGHQPARDLSRQLGDVMKASRIALQLAPRGWAPCGLLPVAEYLAAGQALDGPTPAVVDEYLADAWERSAMLPGVLARVGALGAGIDDRVHEVSSHRESLIDIAWGLHRDGIFAAAIPIVLAQVEGICSDVTGGKSFFSKHPSKQAVVTDEVTLTGLDTALGVTRDAFSIDVRSSAATGQLARHGIAHGREVGYGTRVNSWKSWVLLLAVWEWANQRLCELDRQRVRDAEERWAGSDEIDDEGRRRDRRGFMATRLALRELAFAQLALHRTTGRFGTLADLDKHLPGMGDRSSICIVEATDQLWWAYRLSDSGWVFGIGAVDEPASFCFWDGPVAPVSGPVGAGWSREEPPNWRSETVPGFGDALPY